MVTWQVSKIERPMNDLIRLDSLSKSFGGRPAVTDLSLAIHRGEIFGLLGHNGAGKSTTFGMMLGHVTPDAGEAFVCGHSVQQDRANALKRVGAIFETPCFYDYLSGWQNLRFLVSLSGIVPDARLREVVELVGLTKRIDSPVAHYSHGMRQRLALAQALLPEPEFILLDEPTEGLDPAGIHEMREMIKKLRDERGLTVMLSSHLLSEVEQLCDRVAILDGGKLVFCGEWREGPPQWRLSLDDWAKAAIPLARHVQEIEGEMVVLRDGVDISDLVSDLVQHGVRVRGVELLRPTLEDFYLGRIHK